MCLLPAGPGSLAARPAKQAGKCVYKLFKLWINFSGVCVCVSPHVVIFQKSGLLEIFSLKLERNLNSLRAGGSQMGGRPGGCRAGGVPRGSLRTEGARSSAAAQREEKEGGGVRPSISRRLSVKGHQPGPGARRPLPVPSSGHRSTAGGRVVFPGSPGDKGIPTPPKGVRGDAAPRRRKAEEGCPGRGWVRSNEDSFVTRGVLFLSKVERRRGAEEAAEAAGPPLASSPPAPRPS